MDGLHTGALTMQHATDVHEARVVTSDDVFSATLDHVSGLVSSHRYGHVRVLQREGAAKSAALIRLSQVDELNAADGLE